MTKLSRAKRKAVARVLLAGFSMCNTVANSVMVFNKLEWGDDVFTQKEKRYLEQVRKRIHNDGELLRKLAWKMSR